MGSFLSSLAMGFRGNGNFGCGGMCIVGAPVFFMFVHDIWFARSVLRQEREKAEGKSLPEFKFGVV